MKITAIYDRGAEWAERYTVVIDDNDDTYNGKWWAMIAISEEGGQVYSQLTQGVYYFGGDNSHLGKRCAFENLSQQVQQSIAGRIVGLTYAEVSALEYARVEAIANAQYDNNHELEKNLVSGFEKLKFSLNRD